MHSVAVMSQELRPHELGGRVVITPDGQRLTVIGAVLNDIGAYTCIARNLVGENGKEFDVDVHVPPYFQRGGSDDVTISVIRDQPAYLYCPFDGHPFPTVQWLKDRAPINDEYIPSIRSVLYLLNIFQDTGQNRVLSLQPKHHVRILFTYSPYRLYRLAFLIP